MGKAFGLIAMLGGLYMALTIYAEGMEQAFGGIFAPIESVNGADAPLATGLTGAAQAADMPAERQRRIPITEQVRDRVQADIDYGASRRGY